jgi:hypothetical protein
MQRLVKCCLRAVFSSADLELPAKGMQAPRAACGYGTLIRRFTARRYSAAAGDALTPGISHGACDIRKYSSRFFGAQQYRPVSFNYRKFQPSSQAAEPYGIIIHSKITACYINHDLFHLISFTLLARG